MFPVFSLRHLILTLRTPAVSVRRPFLAACLLTLTVGSSVLAAPAARAQAQSAGATVHGSVSDPDGAIIPGATVILSAPKGKAVTVKSGSDGSFRALAPSGTYTVTVTMPGFANFQQTGVVLTLGGDVQVNAKLAVGEQTEVVNVTSQATQVSVDSDSNASATVIKGKDLEALSDDPDELASELSALAGPAAGPNGGQIYVDGFTGGQLPPKSSIREIRINQNPFSAQFDRLGYGRVEVFTKPGTDKLHGSLSIFGNDKPFNTSTPFLGAANNQPGYFTVFAMGNVTGALSKSASFSVGGNYRNISNNNIINPAGFYSATATDTTPCAPGVQTCSASFGFPTSARAISQPSHRYEISPRFDFALGAKNVLTIRYNYEKGASFNSGIGGNSLASLGVNSTSDENQIQISDTQTFSSKLVNETRFEYQRETSNNTPLSTGPRISVQGAFSYGGATPQNTVNRHIEVQNYTSLALSKHFVRAGGRLRLNQQSNTTSGNINTTTGYNYTYSFLLDPCTDPSVTTKPAGCAVAGTATRCASIGLTGTNYVSSYQCGTPSQFSLTNFGQPTVTASENDLGLYAEDDWKVRPNLTFSYGGRFEVANVTSAHDWAPRTSVAYGIPRSGGKAPMTVLRGGFGIFYDRFGLNDFLTNAENQRGVQNVQSVVNPGAACSPGSPVSACNVAAGSRIELYSLAPNLRSSYIMQAALGVDQQLGKIGTLSVNWLPSRGNHQYLTRVSVNGSEYDYQYQSTGVFRENQIIVNSSLRLGTVSFFTFGSFNFTNANSQGSNFIPTSTDPSVDYGRASFAQRAFVVASGSWTAPFKISVSPFLLARSGTPYNVTLGQDLNGDSVFNERPAFASGSTANCTNASTFNQSVTPGNYNEIPINYCTGPAAVVFNLRLARTFGFGNRSQTATSAKGTGGPNSGGAGNSGGAPPGGGRGSRGGGMSTAMGGAMGGGRGGPGGPGGGFGGATGKKYNLTLGLQAQNLFNNVPYSAPISTLSSASQFGTYRSLLGQPFAQSNAVRRILLQATLNF